MSTIETTGTPTGVAAPAVVVQQPPLATAPVTAAPVVVPVAAAVPVVVAPIAMRQDAAVTSEIKRINWLMFAFAWLHLIGAIIFLAGNGSALEGPFTTRHHGRFLDGFRLLVSGAAIMAFASLMLHIAHLMDIFRSRRLGISNFLVYSSFVTSTTFFIAYLLIAIGWGLISRFFDGKSGERKYPDGLIIITVASFLAAFGVFHAFVGHWGSLDARSRNRVHQHTFSPSHLRAWSLSAGNFDYMIGWVIYVVASLAAAVNASFNALGVGIVISFLNLLLIVGIITSVFWILGDLRTVYLTWPTRAIYTDLPSHGAIADPFPAAYAAPVASV